MGATGQTNGLIIHSPSHNALVMVGMGKLGQHLGGWWRAIQFTGPHLTSLSMQLTLQEMFSVIGSVGIVAMSVQFRKSVKFNCSSQSSEIQYCSAMLNPESMFNLNQLHH